MESGSRWRIPHLLTDPSSLGPETPASPQLLVHPLEVSDFSRALAPHHLRRVSYLARELLPPCSLLCHTLRHLPSSERK